MRILALLVLLPAACAPGAGNELANGGAPPPPPRERCAPENYSEEACVDLLPAARMRGVWVTGFEQSGFIADATEAPAIDDTRWAETWLSFADGASPDPSVWAEVRSRGGHAHFAIDFIGRRSRRPGGYGHLNGARNFVLVDRIVSIRALADTPEP